MTGATNGTNGTSSTLPAIITSAEEFVAHEYDYVIVGGGTAGLVIAARLSENPDVTIGVIEAGKNRLDDMIVDTPALFTQMLGNPEYDWNLKTTPQVCSFLLVIESVKANTAKVGTGERRHHLPRGKALGGRFPSQAFDSRIILTTP